MPKTMLATITACVAALALASGTALANTLSVDDQDFRISWSPLSASLVGLSTIACDVTLTGSFHSPRVAKTTGALVGHITSASVEQPSCEGASVTTLGATLPWHIQYQGFNGSLPNITGLTINILGWSWAYATELASCLSRSWEAEPAALIANVGRGGAVSSMTAEEGAVLDMNDTSGIFCDFAGVNYTFSGTGMLEDTTGSSLVLTSL